MHSGIHQSGFRCVPPFPVKFVAALSRSPRLRTAMLQFAGCRGLVTPASCAQLLVVNSPATTTLAAVALAAMPIVKTVRHCGSQHWRIRSASNIGAAQDQIRQTDHQPSRRSGDDENPARLVQKTTFLKACRPIPPRLDGFQQSCVDFEKVRRLWQKSDAF